ncbi:MAG: DUF1543 domain-containing protein [Ginsengibacter sp.]
MKLFMVLIGCKPKGRNTEQHDIFFGIADHLAQLVPDMISWWPEAKGQIHIDAWREVNNVDSYQVKIVKQNPGRKILNPDHRIFFINLGGYKKEEFEEYHYKVLSAATSKSEAILASKQTAFFKHTGFKGATSHIDDKYGIDVDDVFEIADILEAKFKAQFSLVLKKTPMPIEDELHIGYLKLEKIKV